MKKFIKICKAILPIRHLEFTKGLCVKLFLGAEMSWICMRQILETYMSIMVGSFISIMSNLCESGVILLKTIF